MTDMTLAERVTALEARVLRHDDAIALGRDGLALLSEDARAARSELAEFRQEVIGRLDGVDALLRAIATHVGVPVPPAE